jgi:hypothetical protein
MKRDILCSLAVRIILKLRQGISRYGIRVWGGGRLFGVVEAKLESLCHLEDSSGLWCHVKERKGRGEGVYTNRTKLGDIGTEPV